jgi:hypothetical protein
MAIRNKEYFCDLIDIVKKYTKRLYDSENDEKSTVMLVENNNQINNNLLSRMQIKNIPKDNYCLLTPDKIVVGGKNQTSGLLLFEVDGLKDRSFCQLCDYVLLVQDIIYYIELKSTLGSNSINKAKYQFKNTKSLMRYISDLIFSHNLLNNHIGCNLIDNDQKAINILFYKESYTNFELNREVNLNGILGIQIAGEIEKNGLPYNTLKQILRINE